MTWQGIHGHDEVVEQFRRAIRRRRLATSFLFVGPSGVGKYTFAIGLARALLCEARDEVALDPCGECPACQQVAAGTHPDVQVVAKPKDKAFIPLELLIGDKDHRGRAGLCYDLSLKPYMGRRKIAVIDDADHLNAEGANCLLKTLEEPSPCSILILVGTSPAKQLPTIRSRCQMIRFRRLPAEVVAELLLARRLVTDPDQAQRLGAHSEGSLRRAEQLVDEELWAFRDQLYRRLAAPVLDSVEFSRTVSTLVDAAGKQAAARRERFRQVVGFGTDFYRYLLHVQSGAAGPEDADLRRFVEQARDNASADSQRTTLRLQRCLDAMEQIDRNANQSTLIEAWLDDLARA